jgi:hypothetical protein
MGQYVDTIPVQRIQECAAHHGQKEWRTNLPGGTGKTFLINLLLAKVRQTGKIALAVAASGIATALLTDGRTAQSALKLPVDLAHCETSTCNIEKAQMKPVFCKKLILFYCLG